MKRLIAAIALAALPHAHASDMAAQCIECHGANGIASSSGYPNLAGQHADYLFKQLTDFREGRRSSPFMNIVAAKLSAADIPVMVRYFAGQPAADPAPAAIDNGTRKLYSASCASCHGADAKGAGAIPSLRGQQSFYLREQLLNFRLGQRNNSPARVMNQAADALSDADIDALARYLSQL
jgi:cytochrome c553